MAVGLYLRTFKQSLWLGWKIDSNWTDPFLFAIYSMIRPFSGLLIVGFIYIVGSAAGGTIDPNYLAFLIVGNVFFIYLVQIANTMAFLVNEDRSRYEVLKHIYLAPGTIHPYFFGRAFASMLNATISVVLTLVFSVFIFNNLLNLGVPIQFDRINYTALVLTVVIGTVGMIFLGYILSSINLVSFRLQWTLSDYVTGFFFLLGGVVFPTSLLPWWLQSLARSLPITYFLEAARASIANARIEEMSGDLVLLTVTTVLTTVVAIMVFRYAEHRARSLGLLDRKSEY
jgi:ABC-2 type transport system permease protein